jgi:hypothetical protein
LSERALLIDGLKLRENPQRMISTHSSANTTMPGSDGRTRDEASFPTAADTLARMPLSAPFFGVIQ